MIGFTDHHMVALDILVKLRWQMHPVMHINQHGQVAFLFTRAAAEKLQRFAQQFAGSF